jgi:hypothetical protein
MRDQGCGGGGVVSYRWIWWVSSDQKWMCNLNQRAPSRLIAKSPAGAGNVSDEEEWNATEVQWTVR